MFEHGVGSLIKAGGFTLVFIAFCSVLVLAVAVERIVALWGFLHRANSLAETIKRCLYRGAMAEARTACERSSSPAAEVFLVGFERHGRSTSTALDAAVERERQRVSLRLKGQLWILGTIGATAPFIGLFGTVWGIMRAFNEIGAQHKSGFDVVSAGLSEALITTAFGIIVGIESVMIYNYFQSRLAKTALELKLMAEEFVELLRERPSEGKSETKPDAKSETKSDDEDAAKTKSKPKPDETAKAV